MSKWIVVFILAVCSLTVSAQKNKSAAFKPETIELLTPWIFDGDKAKPSDEQRLRSCFNFILMDHGCGSVPLIAYGDRIGINWDLFHISGGKVDRTRMIEIGKYSWTDKFTVPYVEPWSSLQPGEKRTITINASGGSGPPGRGGEDGPMGVAGINGDGTYTPMPTPKRAEPRKQQVLAGGKTYATANVVEQVSSTVKDSTGKVRDDGYSPMVEVKKDYMYVVRVVDESRDFYVIIHVDDLVRGQKVKLSYWKFEPVAL